MKFICKLTGDQIIQLADEGELTNIFLIPLNDEIKHKVQEYLEENTGFDNTPVMGLVKVNNNEGLEKCWEDLGSLLPIKQGDFLVEFDMPDDMVAVIGYDSLLEVLSRPNLVNNLNDYLTLEEHTSSETEAAFVGVLFAKFCSGYKLLGPNWEQESCNLKPLSEIKKSDFFNRG